jgi:hypothetical protein
MVANANFGFNTELRCNDCEAMARQANSGREAEEGVDEISSLDPWCCGRPDSHFASLMYCFS